MRQNYKNENKQITVNNGDSKEAILMNKEKQKQKQQIKLTPETLGIICILFLISFIWFVYNLVMYLRAKRKLERRRQNAKNRAINQNLMIRKGTVENVYTIA